MKKLACIVGLVYFIYSFQSCVNNDEINHRKESTEPLELIQEQTDDTLLIVDELVSKDSLSNELKVINEEKVYNIIGTWYYTHEPSGISFNKDGSCIEFSIEHNEDGSRHQNTDQLGSWNIQGDTLTINQTEFVKVIWASENSIYFWDDFETTLEIIKENYPYDLDMFWIRY